MGTNEEDIASRESQQTLGLSLVCSLSWFRDDRKPTLPRQPLAYPSLSPILSRVTLAHERPRASFHLGDEPREAPPPSTPSTSRSSASISSKARGFSAPPRTNATLGVTVRSSLAASTAARTGESRGGGNGTAAAADPGSAGA